MERSLEFSIDGLQFIGAGNILIAGMNNKDPLRVGDLFTGLEQYPRIATDPIAIRLRVEAIQFYGHSIYELDRGMTAGLVVGMQEIEKLTLGKLLIGVA